MSSMSIIKNFIFPVLLTVTIAVPAQAAFSLSGTRFIYEEGKKSTSFEVTNNSQDTYGGQVWIENVSRNTSDVFMVPSPPFFKIDGESKQIVRLMNVNDELPKDRESLFMLNVQEIPPKPKDDDGNVLAIAMNTKVKLIYRPKALTQSRKDAEKQLTLVNRDGSMWIKNPTPYYFAVIAVKSHERTVKLSDDVMKSVGQFAPNSEINLRIPSLTGEVSVDAINDWGGVVNYVVTN